ncbi:hypothetical protein [Roseateles sp. MS654]|uniref:hypothetical protein n=1 Tax=Roseateles sp. MS654 TaxID=3412685 RepID=UPI003C2B3DEC
MRNEHSRVAKWMLWGIWVGPTILYAAVVLIFPSSILSENGWLASFCDHTQRLFKYWIPSADFYKHAASTRFPEIARLATSFVLYWWQLSALGMFLFFFPAIWDRGRRWGAPGASPTPLIIVAPILTFVFFWGFYCLPGDWSFAEGASTGSRLGYFVLSWFGACMTSIVAGYWPILVTTSITKVFEGEK